MVGEDGRELVGSGVRLRLLGGGRDNENGEGKGGDLWGEGGVEKRVEKVVCLKKGKGCGSGVVELVNEGGKKVGEGILG